MKRCEWVADKTDLYKEYHDTEWGTPEHDDLRLYEMLILESFQAGLSWYTILRKREAFRESFAGFDVNRVAGFDDEKIEELMQNKDIIRNRSKIRAAVNNSRVFMEIQDEFKSFDSYIWSFTDNQTITNTDNNFKTTSELSDKISADLKKRGMKFVGSLTIYAYLQSIGIINDHDTACFRYQELLNKKATH